MGAELWFRIIDSTDEKIVANEWKKITHEETKQIVRNVTKYIEEIVEEEPDILKGKKKMTSVAKRKSPPYHASGFKQGQTLIGLDGNAWIKQGKKWVKLFRGSVAKQAETLWKYFDSHIGYGGTLGFYGARYSRINVTGLKSEKSAVQWLATHHEKWTPALSITFGVGQRKKTMIGGWASS